MAREDNKCAKSKRKPYKRKPRRTLQYVEKLSAQVTEKEKTEKEEEKELRHKDKLRTYDGYSLHLQIKREKNEIKRKNAFIAVGAALEYRPPPAGCNETEEEYQVRYKQQYRALQNARRWKKKLKEMLERNKDMIAIIGKNRICPSGNISLVTDRSEKCNAYWVSSRNWKTN